MKPGRHLRSFRPIERKGVGRPRVIPTVFPAGSALNQFRTHPIVTPQNIDHFF